MFSEDLRYGALQTSAKTFLLRMPPDLDLAAGFGPNGRTTHCTAAGAGIRGEQAPAKICPKVSLCGGSQNG